MLVAVNKEGLKKSWTESTRLLGKDARWTMNNNDEG